MGKGKVSNKRIKILRRFNEELTWDTTRKYVEHLRSRGELLSIGQVDIDVPQIIWRHFICDAQRCIQYAGDRALIDRSCCCRYEVPTSAEDRQNVLAHLDEVRPNLPDGHRLIDPDESPFEQDGDFGYDLVSDNPLGGCEFNQYLPDRCSCILHRTALEHGEDPALWKPLACSLWPLAINDYDDDEGERFLVTIYCEETEELFNESDDEPFACIVDQDPAYPRLYESERHVLEFLFGKRFWRTLHSEAKQILAR